MIFWWESGEGFSQAAAWSRGPLCREGKYEGARIRSQRTGDLPQILKRSRFNSESKIPQRMKLGRFEFGTGSSIHALSDTTTCCRVCSRQPLLHGWREVNHHPIDPWGYGSPWAFTVSPLEGPKCSYTSKHVPWLHEMGSQL